MTCPPCEGCEGCAAEPAGRMRWRRGCVHIERQSAHRPCPPLAADTLERPASPLQPQHPCAAGWGRPACWRRQELANRKSAQLKGNRLSSERRMSPPHAAIACKWQGGHANCPLGLQGAVGPPPSRLESRKKHGVGAAWLPVLPAGGAWTRSGSSCRRGRLGSGWWSWSKRTKCSSLLERPARARPPRWVLRTQQRGPRPGTESGGTQRGCGCAPCMCRCLQD